MNVEYRAGIRSATYRLDIGHVHSGAFLSMGKWHDHPFGLHFYFRRTRFGGGIDAFYVGDQMALWLRPIWHHFIRASIVVTWHHEGPIDVARGSMISVFWSTPLRTPWRRIPDGYVYGRGILYSAAALYHVWNMEDDKGYITVGAFRGIRQSPLLTLITDFCEDPNVLKPVGRSARDRNESAAITTAFGEPGTRILEESPTLC